MLGQRKKGKKKEKEKGEKEETAKLHRAGVNRLVMQVGLWVSESRYAEWAMRLGVNYIGG